MKRINVTDNAARIIESIRSPEELNRRKAEMCDILCDVIAGADVNGTYGKPLVEHLMQIVDAVELIEELSKVKDSLV